MSTDSPDLVIAKWLLDHLKLRGFQFHRAAPGEDGPLVGHRVSGGWVETIHIEGFSRDCLAWRQRTCSLLVPGDAPVEQRTHGSALNVLNEVLTWKQHRDSYTVISPRRNVKHTKSKAQRGLVTRRIVYANRRRPHDRHQELKVDVRNGTIIDIDYATGLVAVRTPLPLADIKIIRIEVD